MCGEVDGLSGRTALIGLAIVTAGAAARAADRPNAWTSRACRLAQGSVGVSSVSGSSAAAGRRRRRRQAVASGAERR